jgi:hypothetical protein
MKLLRSALAIAAVSLAALTLYFANVAPTPAGLADATSAASSPNPSDLTQGRTLVLNVATLVTKVADAKKRVADLWAPRDVAEALKNPRTAGDGDLVDTTPNGVHASVRQDRATSSANKQALTGVSSAVDIVEG